MAGEISKFAMVWSGVIRAIAPNPMLTLAPGGGGGMSAINCANNSAYENVVLPAVLLKSANCALVMSTILKPKSKAARYRSSNWLARFATR